MDGKNHDSNRKLITADLRLIQYVVLLITLLIFTFLVVNTGIYDHVQSSIVEVLCLSCIKLQPYTSADFIFDTMTNTSHPQFVLENLTYGPVFLMYSQDICEACDKMQPVIQELFNVSYSKEDNFYSKVKIDNFNLTYIYINIDHTTSEKKLSQMIYDKDNIRGVPMFTIITLGNDHGTVKPYYTSVYGTLNLPTSEKRSAFIYELLKQSINIYYQNKEGYHPH
ncbi:MAG: hypothetical protein QXS02_02650 [Candidatus Thermoplasmatota archaeon]